MMASKLPLLSKMNWNLVKENDMAVDGFVESGIMSKMKWNLGKKYNLSIDGFRERERFQSGKQIGHGNWRLSRKSTLFKK